MIRLDSIIDYLHSVTMTRTQPYPVRLPLLKEESLIRVRATTYSFREGGPRIQHEMINGRHIFHNYGLGASAVPLAYGASTMSAKAYTIFFDPTADEVHCAVIGAGVLGLMTALELNKRGRKVTIYSASIPELEAKEAEQISSQAIPKVWMPNEYDWSEDMLKHQLIAKLSYDYLRESVQLSRYQSLRELPVLDVASESEDLREVVSNYVCDMVRPSRVSYENGSLEDGCFYKTFHIDSRLYLEELKIEAMLRGVRFVQKRFSSLEDIIALSEMAIWNCTNEASAYLFDDSAFQKQHFITLDFEEVPISKEDFAFRGRSDGQEFELQCIGNKQHLILRVDQPNLSKQAIADRLTLVRRAIESRRLQPKL